MAGLLEQIELQINDIAQNYNNLSLNVIEQPLYPDLHLKGIPRFSRRIGSTSIIAVIEPENEIELTESAQQNAQEVYVNANEKTFVKNWFTNYAVPGSNGRLLKVVVQVDNEYHKLGFLDLVTSTLTFETGDVLFKDYDSGTAVKLYGVPVRVRLFKDDGETKIEIISQYPIMKNDVVLLELSDQVISFNEYSVLSSERIIPETISPCFPYEYIEEYRHIITLEDESDFLIRMTDDVSEAEIDAGVEILNHLTYLKGFGAYESREFFMPTIQGRAQTGPFALDYMSGQLYDFAVHLKDFMNVKVKTSANVYLYGSDSEFETINKNTSIPNCISNDKILLWDKVNGHVNYEPESGLLHLIPDENGDFAFKVDLTPAISIPARWRFKVLLDDREPSSVGLQVQLYPNSITQYTVPQSVNGYSISTQSINTNINIKGFIDFHETLPSITGYSIGDIIAVDTSLKILNSSEIWVDYASSEGDKYIVSEGSTGIYSTYVNSVATLNTVSTSGFWNFIVATPGSVYYNEADEKYYQFELINSVESWSEVDSGSKVEKIIISFSSQYPIKITPWVLIDSQVRKLQYQVLAHAFGKNWQSTGLMVKPLMKSLINLFGEYDEARYNNGYVYS